ncbi:hypothetical protein LOD99_4481 [Oopsacas minuta]|uniref:Membrane magnesium transporter n=1 Tax=Oopsacas minuta TaxID=111878 RepID=A0AAV7JUT5_9METZ|nr:hypothetical protein LOD99_4481 [Oopsacas minuta]
MLHRYVLVFGLILLVHSTFSTIQYCTLYKSISRSSISLAKQPLHLLLETILGLFMSIAGITAGLPQFKDIRKVNELNRVTYDSLSYRPSFQNLDHRSRVLYPIINTN